MPDINVWIALASDRHIHHEAAEAWFGNVESEGAAFCRITQMGLLRLVTNRHVMGSDVLAPKEAWQIYQQFSRDLRIIFLNEPSSIESEWRKLMQVHASANNWTDAYLAAFALVHGLKVVSFDAGFEKLLGTNAIIL